MSGSNEMGLSRVLSREGTQRVVHWAQTPAGDTMRTACSHMGDSLTRLAEGQEVHMLATEREGKKSMVSLVEQQVVEVTV